MEECMGTITDRFIAVYTSRTDDADRRLRMFHSSCLYGRGVSAKYDVLFHIFLIGFDEESILHITCRMVFGKIHGSEYVQVVFYFGTVGNAEAQSMEYINNFIFYNAQRVACSQFDGISRTRKIHFGGTVILGFKNFFQCSDTFLSLVFQLVQFHAHLFFLLGRYVAEVCHQLINRSFFAKIFNAQGFQFFRIGCLQAFNFLK